MTSRNGKKIKKALKLLFLSFGEFELLLKKDYLIAPKDS